MLKMLFGEMSPAGGSARLSVLIFHRVLLQPDDLFPGEMHARHFGHVCAWLKSWFNVLPLDEAVAHLKAGTLPERSACITFDDGYADNYQVAMPILMHYGLKATFFIATGFLDGGRMWNDTIVESVRGCLLPVLDLSSLGLGRFNLRGLHERRAAISEIIAGMKYKAVGERLVISEKISQVANVAMPEDLMMSSQQVRAMHEAGMQIGAHTHSHPILAQLEELEAQKEIASSRKILEQILCDRVALFAYPNGKPGDDYTSQTIEIVRALGFDAAVSTQWGTSGQGDDVFQVRRFSPWDQSRLLYGARLLNNLRVSKLQDYRLV